MFSQSQSRERAQRVAEALNGFIGVLHGARCTGVLWTKQVSNPTIHRAAKYGLQLTFGMTVLTLRKFEDIWRNHLCFLLPALAPSRALCADLIAECNGRNIRRTANLLIAHYASKTKDFPLSQTEIMELIKSNGWNTEEEALCWISNILPKLIGIRDELMNCYGIESLIDERVTL